MFPPNDAASEKVTKSFMFAPWFESVIVKVEEPLTAAKVAAPAAEVFLIGVMSL
jgi:hypothetical protein